MGPSQEELPTLFVSSPTLWLDSRRALVINRAVLPPVFLVSFSGHRPGSGPGRSPEALEAMRPAIRTSLLELQESAAAEGGSIEIYSSIASGSDTIACEVAEELDLPVHIILPKPEALFAEDFEGEPDNWRRAKIFIDAAHAGTRGSTIRVARGSHISPDCYSETNVQMLEGADAVIAIYNRHETGKSGGTGQLLEQAKALRLPIIEHNPDTGERRDFHLDRFANRTERVNGLGVMDGLRRNITAKGKAIPTDFHSTRDALSASANQSSKWFRRAVVFAIVLHGVAAIVAGAAVSFQQNIEEHFPDHALAIIASFAGIELLLVACALGFMLWHHHRGTQRTWLHCRFATELLRSIESTSGILDPLHPQSKHYPPHWHRFALSATLALLRESPPPREFDTLKMGYLKNRIDDQLDYFESKLAKATPLAQCFGSIASLSAWAAVFVVLGAFIYKLSHVIHAKGDHHTIIDEPTSASVGFFVFLLPIALPLLAGMASSLQTSLDVGRRKVRYREMVDNLKSARHWIEQLESPINLTLAAARVESVLLDEQIEWMAAAEAGQGH